MGDRILQPVWFSHQERIWLVLALPRIWRLRVTTWVINFHTSVANVVFVSGMGRHIVWIALTLRIAGGDAMTTHCQKFWQDDLETDEYPHPYPKPSGPHKWLRLTERSRQNTAFLCLTKGWAEGTMDRWLIPEAAFQRLKQSIRNGEHHEELPAGLFREVRHGRRRGSYLRGGWCFHWWSELA